MGVAVSQALAKARRIGGSLLRLLALLGALLLALTLSGLVFHLIPGVTIGQTAGSSMEPWGHAGDVVVVRRGGGNSLKVGQIIVFHQGGITVLHRVIGISKDADGRTVITTQGDNNKLPDKPVKPEDVIGRFMFRIPLLGTISRAIDAGGGLYVYRYVALGFDLLIVLAYAGYTLTRMTAKHQRTEGNR